MGDRVTVYLVVPLDRREEVLEILPEVPQEDYDHNNGQYFVFNEVNYGELSFLPDLVAKGIPYSSSWCAGNEFGEGTEYGRFTPEGDFVKMTVYNEEQNPSMGSLLEAIDDHEKLKAVILEHKRKTTPMGWENQLDYGKVYLTKKLITPAPD